MVNIIEDWEVLEEYAGDKMGFYQRIDNDGRVEIKVQTGRVGFVKEFDSENDKQLAKILDFCRRRGYIRVLENVRDEQFFK